MLEQDTYQTCKLICIIGIITETMQRINAVQFSRGIHLFPYIYI